MAKPTELVLVYAHWCPHCDPLSLELAPLLAKRLGVPLRLLDIDDPEAEKVADRIVEEHGLWDEDYVIPQAFLEWDDGCVDAVLIADRGSPTAVTRAMWEKLLADPKGLLARTSP